MTCFATNAHGRRHDYCAVAVDVCDSGGLSFDAAQMNGHTLKELLKQAAALVKYFYCWVKIPTKSIELEEGAKCFGPGNIHPDKNKVLRQPQKSNPMLKSANQCNTVSR